MPISLMFMMCQLEDFLVSSTLTCTQERVNMVMPLVLAYRYATYLVMEIQFLFYIHIYSIHVYVVVCGIYVCYVNS